MRINPENIRRPRAATINDWRIPETLGKPDFTEEERLAMDACMAPVETLISHSLRDLAQDGIPVFPGYTLLCGLTQNGLIRAGVSMRAKEMTRKWGEVVGSGDSSDDRAAALTKALEKFDVQTIFRKAAEKCGYLGGCMLFIDTGDDRRDLINPLQLDPRTFPQGTLKALRLVDPYLVYPGIFNSTDPLAPGYYEPAVWYVQGTPVHASRFVVFRENELPTLIRPAYNFFGISLAQVVLDAVAHFTRNRESASKLLDKISLTVFKTNMAEVLAGGGDEELRKRVRYFTNARDFEGVATIDKDMEDIVIINNTLSGVVDIVRQSMEYVAAMFNEPATKLWGISPAGMNATGESDMRNHYDNIAAMQEQIFSPAMARLLDILQMDTFGDIDRDVSFKFRPLAEDDERARAEVNKLKAEVADVYVAMGAIGADEVRDELVKDPTSGYAGLPAWNPDLTETRQEVRLDI